MKLQTPLAVLGLTLLPLSASAQIAVPQSLPNPQSMPVQRGFGFDARSPVGITVAGSGRVTTPVTTVRFVAYVRAMPDEAGALAAMRAAGIDDPVIGAPGNQMFGGQNANGPTVLRGVVRQVTQAKLIAIGRAAADYVRNHPGSSVDNVQFFGRLDDCAAVEQRARAIALGDARRRADAIAATLSVAVDRPIDVTESSGCNNAGESGDVPIDVSTLTATVYVSERVTYGIAAGDAGQRRKPL